MADSMTVFDAFPNAIESDWQIVPMAYSTIAGNALDMTNASNIDIIIDEGSTSDANQSPNSAELRSDTLIYVKPSQLTTIDTSALVAGYAIRNKTNGKVFEIVDAGLGKNQETGIVEHVEMKIRQTSEISGDMS